MYSSSLQHMLYGFFQIYVLEPEVAARRVIEQVQIKIKIYIAQIN